MRLIWAHSPITQPNKRKFSFERSGRHPGRWCISRTSRNGFKTTISYTKATVHRWPLLALASNPSSDFTRKQETFGELLIFFCDAKFIVQSSQDSSAWLHRIPRRRRLFPHPTFVGGQLGRENDFQCILHRRNSLFGLLLHLPHRVVSFGSRGKAV